MNDDEDGSNITAINTSTITTVLLPTTKAKRIKRKTTSTTENNKEYKNA